MGKLKLLWELYCLKRNTNLSQKELAELQTRKLRHILRYAYENSVYYHRAFEEAGITKENIEIMPFNKFPSIDKKILMEHFDELVTADGLKQEEIARFDKENELSTKAYLDRYHLVHSSGSTGKPRYFVYDNAAWNQMLLGIIRGALWDMSMPEILELLIKKPRILYIAATDGRYGGAMAVGDGINDLGASQLQLNVNTPLEEWKKAVEEFEPNIVIGYPSAVKILAELKKDGIINISLTRIITCGEPLSKGLRSFLESVFRLKVVNFYGSSESLAMGVETDTEEGMYLFDDLNYIEFIDGQMYLTSLYNEVQPLIRYRLSDKLQLREDTLHKKYAFSRTRTINGRAEDVLWFRNYAGSRDFLHPLSVEGICVEGIVDYQFKQTNADAFEMLVETDTHADKDYIVHEVSGRVKSILAEKHLDYVHFLINFVEKIFPNPNTGKKQLIIRMKENEESYGRYAG